MELVDIVAGLAQVGISVVFIAAWYQCQRNYHDAVREMRESYDAMQETLLAMLESEQYRNSIDMEVKK